MGALAALDAAALGGDLRALEVMWKERHTNRYGRAAENPVRAYAYLMASVDIKIKTNPSSKAVFTKKMSEDPNLYYAFIGTQLSPDQRRESEVIRAQIVANWLSSSEGAMASGRFQDTA